MSIDKTDQKDPSQTQNEEPKLHPQTKYLAEADDKPIDWEAVHERTARYKLWLANKDKK